MRRSAEEIIKFFAPESINTYYYVDEEDFCGYLHGFTYYSPKHPIYDAAKKRKVTINDLIAERGEERPYKIELINNMMDIYFD